MSVSGFLPLAGGLGPAWGWAVTATRKGTAGANADAAAVYTASDLTAAAAVVDGIGHGPATVRLVPVLAEVAARVGARRGALAGLLSAGELVADEGAGDEPEPDAVGVVAVSVPGGPTSVAWVGDTRAYRWDGDALTLYTTDHTVGQQLRQNGRPWRAAADHDSRARTTLSAATVAAVGEAEIPAGGLVLLTSDGVHEQVPPGEMAALAHAHEADPQALADALVAAARAGAGTARGDATAVVLAG